MLLKDIFEYEDLSQEKQNIITAIAGLDVNDPKQATLLDRVYQLLNTETIDTKISSAFTTTMQDEVMSDKVKEQHKIQLAKIILHLDSDYSAMNTFLGKMEKGGVIDITALGQRTNSFNKILGGDPVAISAFHALSTYGVGQKQKGPGEFALAMLSNRISLAETQGDIMVAGKKVEVKVEKSSGGGRLGYGGSQNSHQMGILNQFAEAIPNLIANMKKSIGLSVFIQGLNVDLPVNVAENKETRVAIASALFEPTFGNYGTAMAQAFKQEDATTIINEYVKQNFDWYKAQDPFEAILMVNFPRQKTAWVNSANDIINLRQTGQLTGFAISVVPSKARPSEQFAQLSMSAAVI